MKTVKIHVRWAAAQPGQDRRLPSGDTLKALAGDQRPIYGGDRLQKEDGSGVAIDWVTGRSYSSARRRLNVHSGQRKGRKERRLSIRASPSVIVVTEKVMREADGPIGRAALTAHFLWKGDRPWVRLGTEQKLARSPKITNVFTKIIGRAIWILMLQEAAAKTPNESNQNPIPNYQVQGDLLQNGVKKPWNVPSLITRLLIMRNMIMSQIQRRGDPYVDTNPQNVAC